MSEQLNILDAIDRAKHIAVIARRDDPETSHEAAGALRKQQARMQRSIGVAVGIIAAHGPLSDFDLLDRWATHWGEPFSESLPRKARHWARQAGLVKHDGYGKHQKRKVRLWAIGRDDAMLMGAWRVKCPHCGGDGWITSTEE